MPRSLTIPRQTIARPSWGFALGSIAITSITVVIVVVGGFIAEQELAQERFERLSRSAAPESIRSVYSVLDRASTRTDTAIDLFSGTNTAEPRASIRALLFEVGFEREFDSKPVVRLTQKQLDGLPPAAASLMPGNSLENLRDILNRIDEALTRKQELQKQLEKVNQQMDSIISQHILISKDVSEFFVLSAQYTLNPVREFMAYKDGVLKDFPELQGLPDNLPDLAALRAALTVAGGRVNLADVDIAKAFADRFGELKKISTALGDSYRAAENTHKESLARASELESELRQLHERLRVLCADTIVFLSLGHQQS